MHSALIYDQANDRDEYGIDIVDTDNDQWAWHPAGDQPMTHQAADARLAELGWRRTTAWTREDELAAAGAGWSAQIEPAE